VLLVKPQFEVGKGRVGAGGVVRDNADRADAVRTVAAAAGQLGLGVLGVTASPLPGPAGNVEYFLWLRRGRRRLTTVSWSGRSRRDPASGTADGAGDGALSAGRTRCAAPGSWPSG
jgi:Predicted rRNA methylase